MSLFKGYVKLDRYENIFKNNFLLIPYYNMNQIFPKKH